MDDPSVTIRWHGQACVTVVSPGGSVILVDPFEESIGYTLPDVEPDAVVTTHNHYDHANVEGVRGEPTVLRGLRPDGDWADVDETVGDVRIRTVGTYHDEMRGAKRGRNAVVCLDAGGLSVVHCGDLGHVLSEAQREAVGPVDVLLVPVGGVYTVDAAEARKVVGQLEPARAVLPMHYATESLTIRLQPVDLFLKGWRHVQRSATNEVAFAPEAEPPDEPEVIVLADPATLA
jgi:L-ascorbate metabolism protein UlaG (beta-lactamase superfamily)